MDSPKRLSQRRIWAHLSCHYAEYGASMVFVERNRKCSSREALRNSEGKAYKNNLPHLHDLLSHLFPHLFTLALSQD